MTDEDWMRQAIDWGETAIANGQTPFGAVIVQAGAIVASAHNIVWLTGDVTAHAEVTAIRHACAALGTIDLTGCAIYSTCEPCPMCFSAIHWARLDRIIYGASIADAQTAGFHEMPISNERMKQLGGSRVEVAGGVLRDECRALFRRWAREPGARAY